MKKNHKRKHKMVGLGFGAGAGGAGLVLSGSPIIGAGTGAIGYWFGKKTSKRHCPVCGVKK